MKWKKINKRKLLGNAFFGGFSGLVSGAVLKLFDPNVPLSRIFIGSLLIFIFHFGFAFFREYLKQIECNNGCKTRKFLEFLNFILPF